MQRVRTVWGNSVRLVVLLLTAVTLPAGDSVRLGMQAGLLAPLQSDLKIATGSGLNPLVGLHLDWNLSRRQTLRTRFDYGFFSSTDQKAKLATFDQSLHTRFRIESVGTEYLIRPLAGAWTVGAGVYLVRWTVFSTNDLITKTGTFSPSGSSSWWREGIGVVSGLRLSRHFETELRVLLSHDGFENQPNRVASCNLVWQF